MKRLTTEEAEKFMEDCIKVITTPLPLEIKSDSQTDYK